MHMEEAGREESNEGSGHREGKDRGERGWSPQAWGSDSGSKQGPSDLRCHLQEAHQAWAHLLSLQHV